MPAEDPAALKRALRRSTVGRILAVPPDERRREQAALVATFDQLPGFNEARCVLLYASAFPEEIDTFPMLRRSLALRKDLVLPRVDRSSKSLRLFRVRDLDRDLTRGTLGVPEPSKLAEAVSPAEIDWARVPGL